MTRRKNTPTICAEADCTAEREWCDRRGVYRSRYCPKHRRDHERHVKPSPPALEMREYTPAEVLEAWRARPFGSEFEYQGVRVFGLQQVAEDEYRVQLAGADAGMRLSSDDRLAKRGAR